MELVECAIFILGYVFGIGFSYLLGKWVFSILFKNQAKAITIEATAYYEIIQQIVSYALGFMIGTQFIDSMLLWPVFLVWLVIQALMARRIFQFDGIRHGLTYAGIDSAGDMFVGALFGTSTATFALLRLTLAAPI